MTDVKLAIPITDLPTDLRVEDAVEALKLGAWDFLTKPVNLTKVDTTIENIMTQVRLQKRAK